MPRKRRTDKRRSHAEGLPIASLHFLASGEALDQSDGEAAFGEAFAWPDAFLNYRDIPALWAMHRDAIEAHARAIGKPEAWCVGYLAALDRQIAASTAARAADNASGRAR